MKVAVLGCGPAGLMAAWAARENGADVKIFSPGRKSFISGAQYLHDEIPGIDLIPFTLEYKKYGSPDGYAEKLYGNAAAPCSWRDYPSGQHTAYPLGIAYDAVWAALDPSCFIDVTITPTHIAGLLTNNDLVVSTIPRPTLCMNKAHWFKERRVFITPKPPKVDDDGDDWNISENKIIYNGWTSDPWYRASNIMGNVFTEYATEQPGMTRVIKPLDTNCNCWEGAVQYVGRYGKWKKGVLVHNAYYEVDYALQSMQ